MTIPCCVEDLIGEISVDVRHHSQNIKTNVVVVSIHGPAHLGEIY